MAASSAMPYGTWRGSSSSRMRGLMKSSLAMVSRASRGVLEESVEGGGGDAGPEEEPPFGAVDGLALGVTRQLQEHLAEPMIGRVAEPRLAGLGIPGMNEGLAVPSAQELTQLRVVLGLLVRSARRVAEVDADEPDAPLAEHGVGEHPGRGADIAAAVQTGQAIHLPETPREAVWLVIVVVHGIPPVEIHACLLAALDHRGRRRSRRRDLDLGSIRIDEVDEGAVGLHLAVGPPLVGVMCR